MLDNDSEPNGDSLGAILVSGVSHGVLILKPIGSFVYAHDDSNTNSDNFSDHADGEGGVDTGTVSRTPRRLSKLIKVAGYSCACCADHAVDHATDFLMPSFSVVCGT